MRHTVLAYTASMASDRSSEHVIATLEAASKAVADFDRQIEQLQNERQVFAEIVRRLRQAQSGGATAQEGAGPTPYKSQKTTILEACRSTEDLWLDSKTIGELIEKTTGNAMNPNSLYSQISNLIKEGLLVRDGRRMCLAERHRPATLRP
jgi:hypothetical protein